MTSKQDFLKRLSQYKGADYIWDETGFIAWQMSTGENYEILFIEVSETRKGYATELFKKFVTTVKPPYTSVFVFRLASNESAGHFYRRLGFTEIIIKHLYKEDAVLGIVNWETLKNNLCLNQ